MIYSGVKGKKKMYKKKSPRTRGPRVCDSWESYCVVRATNPSDLYVKWYETINLAKCSGRSKAILTKLSYGERRRCQSIFTIEMGAHIAIMDAEWKRGIDKFCSYHGIRYFLRFPKDRINPNKKGESVYNFVYLVACWEITVSPPYNDHDK